MTSNHRASAVTDKSHPYTLLSLPETMSAFLLPEERFAQQHRFTSFQPSFSNG
jgi:hypothetical protein